MHLPSADELQQTSAAAAPLWRPGDKASVHKCKAINVREKAAERVLGCLEASCFEV